MHPIILEAPEIIMRNLYQEIRQGTADAIQTHFGEKTDLASIQVLLTKKEFTGHLTVVVFPFVRLSKKSPEQTGEIIGNHLCEKLPFLVNYNVVKGFLNLVISDKDWTAILYEMLADPEFLQLPDTGKTTVVEYCGPNTNKPLHLGHIRNMVIGYSMANILKAAGNTVHKVNIYNDRGIAICKSMLAWLKFANGETPGSSKIKGDHLVGKYYVLFAKKMDEEVLELVNGGMEKENAKKQAPILLEAQELLRKWEAGDPETLNLWKTMNDWVYSGFAETYQKLGVDFEADYFESATYEAGKKMVIEGLDTGVFYRKADHSVWVDLEAKGMDEKILLRSDGTSVYLTQDLGTAQARYNDFNMDQSIYVVANEQDYHFNALKATLQILGKEYANGIFHLSYGMVDLPSGKMKSREGTSVDADDLYDGMLETAERHTKELGKIDGFSENEATELYRILGMGALKYFLLKINPKKKILFKPEESIEFQGDTGPFVQYSHARIQSIINKSGGTSDIDPSYTGELNEVEKDLIIQLYRYPEAIKEAAREFDPSHLANYVFSLSRLYNRFYAESPILKAENKSLQSFRVSLSDMTARIIKISMNLLGIDVPDRM